MLRDVPKERGSLLTTNPASDSETTRAKRTVEPASSRAPERHPGSAYWLICRNGNGPLEVLTTNLSGLCGGEEVLPVFSHEEEAEMFLWLGGLGDGWQVRESAAGELTSILCGLCSGVKKVALDPLPKMLNEKTVGLVSLERERFLDLALGRGRTPRSDGSNP